MQKEEKSREVRVDLSEAENSEEKPLEDYRSLFERLEANQISDMKNLEM
jgi:hypothetical protein